MKDGARFCPNCGNQVNQQQSQPQSQLQEEPQNQAQYEPQNQPQSQEGMLKASAAAGEVVFSSWESPKPQPQPQQQAQYQEPPQPQPQPQYQQPYQQPQPLPKYQQPQPQPQYQQPYQQPQPQYQQPYQQPQPQPQPIYVVQNSTQMPSQSGMPSGAQYATQPSTPPRKKNGIGTAGFVLSLIGMLFSWFPPVSALPWFLGLLFSFIGLFKRPKPLAIIGLVFSIITVVIFIILVWVVGMGLEELDLESLFDYYY